MGEANPRFLLFTLEGGGRAYYLLNIISSCKTLLSYWVDSFFVVVVLNTLTRLEKYLLQVPEGVPCGSVSSVPAAQVPAAPTFHLLQLALPESETKTASEEEGPDVQLQRRHLLREVRRDNGTVSARR